MSRTTIDRRVSDVDIYEFDTEIVSAVMAAAQAEGWCPCGVVASPITGPAGNHEYLLWLRQGEWSADETAAETPPGEEAIRRLVAATLAS